MGRDKAHSIQYNKSEDRVSFILNFIATISRKEHKILLSVLRISEMALSN